MNCQWPGCARKATKITKVTGKHGGFMLYRECSRHYATSGAGYIEKDITEEEYLVLKLEAKL